MKGGDVELRKRILRALVTSGPMNAAEIAQRVDTPEFAVHSALRGMCSRGLVVRVGGRPGHPARYRV